MDWIYFVLLSALGYTAADLFDKYLVDKKVKRPVILAMLARFASVVPLIVLAFIVGFTLPAVQFLPLIAISAAFLSAGLLIYYISIQSGEISRVLPLYQFIPVFILFLSFLFIGEVLGFFDYVGFAIIVLGGLIISAKSMSKLLKVERVFWLVVASSLFYALSYVILKFVLSNAEYFSVFILFWSFQVVFMASLLLSKGIRSHARMSLGKLDRQAKIFIFIDAVISIVACMWNYIAISLGPVTLVEASGNVILIFIFIAALMLTKFRPSVLKEEFDAKSAIQKIAGTVLIIAGVLMSQLL
jgi:transporter family protein